ncbi:MAG: hypothetical protein KJ592_00725 [Nanoarchaeota archaeon]|nr:hypothetical protein [Nanoarchaeota archaeon]
MKRKIALLQLIIHALNYLIILYLFIKSYLSNNIELADISISLIGFIISLIMFIYIELRINKTL